MGSHLLPRSLPSPPGAIAKWCSAHDISEVAESLAFNGARAVGEVELMSDVQVDTLCAGLTLGTQLRMNDGGKAAPGGEQHRRGFGGGAGFGVG